MSIISNCSFNYLSSVLYTICLVCLNIILICIIIYFGVYFAYYMYGFLKPTIKLFEFKHKCSHIFKNSSRACHKFLISVRRNSGQLPKKDWKSLESKYKWWKIKKKKKRLKGNNDWKPEKILSLEEIYRVV